MTDAPTWPIGCSNTGSCSRHAACMYARCAHTGRDIAAEVAAETNRRNAPPTTPPDAPTCRPPPEFDHEPFHWLLNRDTPVPSSAWMHGYWTNPDRRLTPEQMSNGGQWTYSHPCRPDDATERARLEKENARLREALRAAFEQFTFYAMEHGAKGAIEKAETNVRFARRCLAALDGVTGEGE